MSLQVEPLPDDRIRMEIGKLMAQTVKLAAEQAKFNAEAAEMNRKGAWYPAVVIAGATAGGAIITGMLLALINLR